MLMVRMQKVTFEQSQVLESGPLIDSLIAEQRALIGEYAKTPQLAIVTTNKTTAIESYFKSKWNYAEKIGAGCRLIEIASEDQALEEIYTLNDEENTSAI